MGTLASILTTSLTYEQPGLTLKFKPLGPYKFIFGIAWLLLFGPLWGALGVLLGALADTRIKRNYIPPEPEDFGLLYLRLAAKVMKADGGVSFSELAYARAYFQKFFSRDYLEKRLFIFMEYLGQTIDSSEVKYICRQILHYQNYKERLRVALFLYGVAASDLFFHSKEIEQIITIAELLEIRDNDMRMLESRYYKAPEDAYSILEINHDSTDDEIKKHYHNLAKKYHPDKLQDTDQSKKKDASAKFLQLAEAYEQIKKERGIR